jgi:hypothetical protein
MRRLYAEIIAPKTRDIEIKPADFQKLSAKQRQALVAPAFLLPSICEGSSGG